MRTRLVLFGVLTVLLPTKLVAESVRGHDAPTAVAAEPTTRDRHDSASHAKPPSPPHEPASHPPATTKPFRPSLVKRHGPIVPIAFGVGLLALLGSLYARARGSGTDEDHDSPVRPDHPA